MRRSPVTAWRTHHGAAPSRRVARTMARHPSRARPARRMACSSYAARWPAEESLTPASPPSHPRVRRAIPCQARCAPLLLGAATVRLAAAIRRVVPRRARLLQGGGRTQAARGLLGQARPQATLCDQGAQPAHRVGRLVVGQGTGEAVSPRWRCRLPIGIAARRGEGVHTQFCARRGDPGVQTAPFLVFSRSHCRPAFKRLSPRGINVADAARLSTLSPPRVTSQYVGAKITRLNAVAVHAQPLYARTARRSWLAWR